MTIDDCMEHLGERGLRARPPHHELYWVGLFLLLCSPALALGPTFVYGAAPIWFLLRWNLLDDWRYHRIDRSDPNLDRIPLLSRPGVAAIVALSAFLGFQALFTYPEHATVRLIQTGLIVFLILYAFYSRDFARFSSRFGSRWHRAAQDLSRKTRDESVPVAPTPSHDRIVAAVKTLAWVNLGAYISAAVFARASGMSMSLFADPEPIVIVYKFGCISVAMGLCFVTPFLAPYHPARREGVIMALAILTFPVALWL